MARRPTRIDGGPGLEEVLAHAGGTSDAGAATDGDRGLADASAPKGLADEIAFRIEREIVEGGFSPGRRLPQDILCARFGVSRTPVREALRKLQARNLVVVVPNRGATVRVPSRKELLDVYDVRAELEGYAAQLAAERVTDECVARLDSAQAELEQLLGDIEHDGGRPPEVGSVLAVHLERANVDFHEVVLDTAGNERLAQLVRELGRMFPKDYVWRAVAGSAEVRELNLLEHVRIRDAIASADGGTARREIREHVRHARTVLLRHLDMLGFWE